MLVTNFKVFITKNGDGAISYTKNDMKYKVFLTKDDPVITEIFNEYYSQLKPFKNRHYAIAQWIVRDIRAKGYVFKAYSNNCMNIRPVLSDKADSLSSKEIFRLQIIENLHRSKMEVEVSDFERLIH